MDTIINFISSWIELITSVFSEHTLVAAIIALIAVGVIFALEKDNKFSDKQETLKHIFIVFLSWLILVPIIGWLLSAISAAFTAGTEVLGFLGGAISFVYEKFENQPIVVIVIAIISGLTYILLPKLKNDTFTVPVVRVGISFLLFFVITALAIPIINQLEEHKIEVQAKESPKEPLNKSLPNMR